jgi:hypothetical protein
MAGNIRGGFFFCANKGLGLCQNEKIISKKLLWMAAGTFARAASEQKKAPKACAAGWPASRFSTA